MAQREHLKIGCFLDVNCIISIMLFKPTTFWYWANIYFFIANEIEIMLHKIMLEHNITKGIFVNKSLLSKHLPKFSCINFLVNKLVYFPIYINMLEAALKTFQFW